VERRLGFGGAGGVSTISGGIPRRGGVSRGTREEGVPSKDVTEVSDSFRLGLGGGGLLTCSDPNEGSRRIDDVRSGRSERCEVDADEGERRGAGGAGGNDRLVLNSFLALSSGIDIDT